MRQILKLNLVLFLTIFILLNFLIVEANEVPLKTNIALLPVVDNQTTLDVQFPVSLAKKRPLVFNVQDKNIQTYLNTSNIDTDKDGLVDILDARPYQVGVLSNLLYKVNYNHKQYIFRINVNHDYVDFFRIKMPHYLKPDASNISTFIVKKDPYLRDLVEQARYYAKKDKTVNTEQLLISLAHSFSYNADSYTGRLEYPKYPIETLIDQSGDCEDLAILTFNLLAEYKGYKEMAFVFFPRHIGVGFKVSDRLIKARRSIGLPSYYFEKDKKKYLYLETTNPAWNIGQLPKEYKDKSYQIYLAQ